MKLKLLSGGAAQGWVDGVRGPFRDRTGFDIDGAFGPVGGMKDRILAGEAIDIAILTRAAIDELVAADRADPNTLTDVQIVETGLAVKDGTPHPDISSAEGLSQAFRSADALFFPDATKATAGRHIAAVIDWLGIRDAVRIMEFPGGHAAMAEMARSSLANPLGCTQFTEIKGTPGVSLVGPLPEPFALSTTYTAAVATNAGAPSEARRLIDMLTRHLDLR